MDEAEPFSIIPLKVVDVLFPPEDNVIDPVEPLLIVPAPAMEATVSVLPFISKVAPLATVSALLFEMRSVPVLS